jgi:hypothetical protein
VHHLPDQDLEEAEREGEATMDYPDDDQDQQGGECSAGEGDAGTGDDSDTGDPCDGQADQGDQPDAGSGDQGDSGLSGDAGQGGSDAADAQQGGGWLDGAKRWLGIGQDDQAQPDWTDEVAGHYDDPQPDYTRQYARDQGSPVEEVHPDEDGNPVKRYTMPDGTVAVVGANGTQNILYPDGRHSYVWADGDTYEYDHNTGTRTHLRPGETSGTSEPISEYDRRLDQADLPTGGGWGG